MLDSRKKHPAGLLAILIVLTLGVIAPHSAFARTGDGAADGISLQAEGVVDLGLGLVTVAASSTGEFDEEDELLSVNESLPLLGNITTAVP